MSAVDERIANTNVPQLQNIGHPVLVVDDGLHATVLISVSILTIVPCATATSMDS
jgi:hypothetical protein